jgi:hypothetical protein
MAQQSQKLKYGAAALLVAVVIGWLLWYQFKGGSSAEARAPQKTPVLCAAEKCGYSGELELKSLTFAAGAGQQAARAPVYGPGYKCPKCGQNTLYTDPMKCSTCGTLYLPRLDASGAIVQRCPKCNKGA